MERSDGGEGQPAQLGPHPRAPRVPKAPKRSEHSRKEPHKCDTRTLCPGRLRNSGTPCHRFPPASDCNDTREAGQARLLTGIPRQGTRAASRGSGVRFPYKWVSANSMGRAGYSSWRR